MVEIKAPNPYAKYTGRKSLFLAGSIEMGAAENWQDKVVQALKDAKATTLVLNPRRVDWDSSWKQDISDPQFNEQVNWELTALDYADQILFYFDPSTKSPVSLLELGLTAYRDKSEILVICPEGYWRRGNVQIVCQRHGITMMDTLEQFIDKLKQL